MTDLLHVQILCLKKYADMGIETLALLKIYVWNQILLYILILAETSDYD